MKRHDVTHPSPSKQVKAIQSTQHVLLLPADPYHTLSSPLLSGYTLPVSEHQQIHTFFPFSLVDTPKRHTHSTRDVYASLVRQYGPYHIQRVRFHASVANSWRVCNSSREGGNVVVWISRIGLGWVGLVGCLFIYLIYWGYLSMLYYLPYPNTQKKGGGSQLAS